uniref:Uncharacterized protein n=1 Tax=Rhizophora mucronata TaxID=61149 RepID=A0A2P2QEQ9_RHIMU
MFSESCLPLREMGRGATYVLVKFVA